MKHAHRIVLGLTMIACLALLDPATGSTAQVASPAAARNAMSSSELTDIDCVAPAVCWGVGTHRYSESYTVPQTPDPQVIVADRPIVFAKTSSGWAEMDFPAVPQEISDPGTWRVAAELESISCTSAGQRVFKSTTYCVAVGRYFSVDPDGYDINEHGPLTAVWNGRRWTLVDRPLDADDARALARRSDVQCVAARVCYALAEQARTIGEGFAVWHGRRWTFEKVTRPVSASSLGSLSCWRTRQCVAVGDRRGADRNQSQPLIMELSGRRWTTHQARAAKSDLTAVECRNASSCVATGRNVSVIKQAGTQLWRVLPMRGNKTYFSGVSCSAARSCLAVGATFDGSVRPSAQTYDGRLWQSATPPGTRRLSKVDCTSKALCVAVGPKVMMLWNGSSWSKRRVSIRPYTSPPA